MYLTKIEGGQTQPFKTKIYKVIKINIYVFKENPVDRFNEVKFDKLQQK